MTAASRARSALRALYPEIGPWTSAALWSGRAESAIPNSPLEAELAVIHEQKLSGLALDFIARSGATVDPAHRSYLQHSVLKWMDVTAKAVHESTPTLSQLRGFGIEFAVSKGPGLAAYYSSPTLRPFSDIDVLMTMAEFRAAMENLELTGWREADRNEQPRRYVRTLCREGLNLAHPGGGSIDLHHHIPPWLFSNQIDLAGVVRRSAPQTWAGTELSCLSAEDNLLVTALHVVSDRNAPGKSLMVWRDLVECALHAELARAVELARSAGLAGWVHALLSAVPRSVGVAGLASAFPEQGMPAPRRLQLLLNPRTAALGVTATQAMRLPGARAGAFVAAVMVPERRWLIKYHGVTKHPYLDWWVGGRRRAGERRRTSIASS